MTREELFKKNFPQYVTEKGMCLSPFYDIFCAGLEAGEPKWHKVSDGDLPKGGLTMLYSYLLTGETPSKKNSRINTRSGKSFPNKKYSAWACAALAELIKQKRPCMPIDYPVKLSVDFYHADNVCRDSDNQLSSLLDILQDVGILADDRWQIVQAINVRNFKADTSWCKIVINEGLEHGNKRKSPLLF